MSTHSLHFLTRFDVNFHRKFTNPGAERRHDGNLRKKYGKTIGDYITSYRIEKAEEILLNSEKSIKSIALECGFSDQNYFTKVFVKKNNCTPSRFREGIK